MSHLLKVNVPDKLYDSLKRHQLLNDAPALAIEGLINGIIVKINKGVYQRKT